MTLMTLTTGWKIPTLAAATAAMGVLAFSKGPVALPSARLGTMSLAVDGAALREDAPSSKGFAAGSGGFARNADALQSVAASPAPERAASPAAPRKIVRSGSLTLQVPDSGKARSLARAAAAKLGAELEDDRTDGEGSASQAVLTFSVAPARLDALIESLQAVGRVTVRSLSSQNMGEEYVDLRSRLSNLRRVESRLNELLSFKTQRLGDVLQVERELERVGREIETIVGRMKYIDALAASSRLTVTLCEPAQEQAHTGVLWDVRNAFVAAFNTFLGTGLALVKMTFWLAAIALWVAPVSLLAWAAARRFAARP